MLGLSVLAALFLLLFLVLGHPHLDANGLRSTEKILLIESLDGLLGIGDIIVHNIGVLRLNLNLTVLLDGSIDFEGEDLNVLSESELLSHIFL